MAGALVDSDVLVDVLRGAPGAEDKLANIANSLGLATSTVTVFELLRGARDATEVRKVFGVIEAFEVFPLDTPAAADAAEIWKVLKGAGTPIDTGDLLIAGIAIATGLRLVTRNVRDFGRVPGLDLIAF